MQSSTKKKYLMPTVDVTNGVWTLEIQGKRVSLKQTLSDYRVIPQKPGRRIREFSRAARLRQLRFVAGIDWHRVPHGIFITLTYPDECVPKDYNQSNRHRYLFHRYMENYLHKQISLLWRIEWKPRLSGSRIGSHEPHIHLIVFGVRFIPHQEIRRWWKTIVHANGPIATDVTSLDDEGMHGIYVSKYTAKMPESSSLDNHANLNINGRHYGYLRRQGIPQHERVRFINLSLDSLSQVRQLVQSLRPAYDTRFDAGVTLLGPLALRFREEVARLAIDEMAFPVYDS